MTQKIRCLIVEDEPIAAEILEDYIAQVPHLYRVATCRDALLALEVLNNEHIDLIFLDIHLPKLKGIEFARTLKNKPQIIFTTAYHEYAIEGFELAALDYLLKPFTFSRFLQAVNRMPISSGQAIKTTSTSIKEDERKYLFFNVNKKQVKVMLDEITHIESIKDYVSIHFAQQHIVVKHQLKELEKILPNDRFVRVHRSYIVAIKHISAYTKEFIEIGAFHIPIGRSYKEALRNRF